MKIHDISVPLSPKLPVWPGDPQIVMDRHRALSKGDPGNDSILVCGVHSGTHVDAPWHYAPVSEGKRSVLRTGYQEILFLSALPRTGYMFPPWGH